jgi:hypothetical protein
VRCRGACVERPAAETAAATTSVKICVICG